MRLIFSEGEAEITDGQPNYPLRYNDVTAASAAQ